MRPSEDDLIATYFAPLAGAGGLRLRDDAALATPAPGHDLIVTKDMLVAGVHFFPEDPPDAIARKALRVNLSDLAAKGARPTGFLLGLALPHDWSEAWLAAFAGGLAADCRAFACPILGGDTVATPGPLVVSITAFGEVAAARMIPRTGARDGDHLYVSGVIGDAALGLALRRADKHDAPWMSRLPAPAADALRARYLLPIPRLDLRDALRDHAHAAMDVSDGFVGDLEKMLRLEGLTTALAVADVPLSAAARCAIDLEPGLLATALTGGDDYEILCAVAPENGVAFEAAARRGGVTVTRVGVAIAGKAPVRLLDDLGLSIPLPRARFQHFD